MWAPLKLWSNEFWPLQEAGEVRAVSWKHSFDRKIQDQVIFSAILLMVTPNFRIWHNYDLGFYCYNQSVSDWRVWNPHLIIKSKKANMRKQIVVNSSGFQWNNELIRWSCFTYSYPGRRPSSTQLYFRDLHLFVYVFPSDLTLDLHHPHLNDGRDTPKSQNLVQVK